MVSGARGPAGHSHLLSGVRAEEQRRRKPLGETHPGAWGGHPSKSSLGRGFCRPTSPEEPREGAGRLGTEPCSAGKPARGPEDAVLTRQHRP